MDMELRRSQSLKLLPIAALLIITPLVSTSLRFKYLYFIVNILIITVGLDAGLLSFFLHSEENKKSPVVVSQIKIVSEVSPDHYNDKNGPLKPVKVEKCSSEKICVEVIEVVKVIKKSPSKQSIFFIEGGDDDDNESRTITTTTTTTTTIPTPTHDAEQEEEFMNERDEEEEEEEEVGGDLISGQELYQKAETFIGNFYKQLKMQREESWKKLHDLSHKAF